MPKHKRESKGTMRVCTGCYKPIGDMEKHASYAYSGGTFYFHSECYKKLCNGRGRLIHSKMVHAVLEFSRKGYESKIIRATTSYPPKAHVTSFEPANYRKLNDLEMIIQCLQHYKSPLSRKFIATEAQIPYTTVTWRIWEYMEGRHDKPLFFIDEKERGPRGVELVGLVDFS